ncbi:MAG: DNA polymerase/3'-5' exonuclease PolX [Chloroflexi bacterium]|nr:DNA polymerase/3'-5' exonuclease PolX [Chloroflexota bacterium]
MPVTNEQVAKVFENMAGLLELKGDVVFKIRAYQRAARTITQLPESLELMVREGKDLQEIPGIGEAIAKKIAEYVTTRKVSAYEELKAEFPSAVLEVMEIPGVGPKTAGRLVQELSISTVEELEQALLDGRVAALPRLGEKSAQNILKAIRSLRSKERRIPLGKALPVAEAVIAALQEQCPQMRTAIPVGSLRRMQETIGDIDIMAVAPDGAGVIDSFVELPLVVDVLVHGPKKASVVVAAGLQVDLRIVEEDSFGSMLQYFTGSKEHNIVLREYALRVGLSLNEYGITTMATGVQEKLSTEEAFYGRLGLDWIPPELRQGMHEVELAAKHALPRLVEARDLKGDLHVHSDWSDGRDSLEDMVAAARERGYQYVAITDHSQGLGVAHGLTLQRLREQRSVLRSLEERFGIRVLQGSEVDIRADGSLDFPDEVLAELDIVIASVHSAFGQPREKLTERVVRAMHSPYLHVLAHPTGRLLGERPPLDLDMEAVFKAALETDVALEVNSSPDRLDLKDVHVLRAKDLGVPLVVSTDAHRREQLAQVRFGVATARRGWCGPQHVVNTQPLAEFMAWVRRKRP